MKSIPSTETQTRPYNVPIIPTDLRQNETILQIADALEYLDKVANDVFTRIADRVTDNKKRLSGITSRINDAQAKIDKIKGTNKATKIFSSAKYPASEHSENYKTIFNVDRGLQTVKHSHRHITSKHQEMNESMLKEKLQFYNVHVRSKSDKSETDHREGLGRLPKNISSVSSLLLFNTSENPYKKYVMLDPLGVVTKTRKTDDDLQEDGLAGAPSTILHGDQFQKAPKENFMFIPVAGDVPELLVPEFLELPGIADDMLFSGEAGSSIAPSVPDLPVPDLPGIEPDITLPDGPIDLGGSAPPLPSAAPPPPTSAAPPPPTSAPPPPPPPPSAPPPPPPPPPSSGAAPPPPAAAPAPSEPTSSVDGGRSNLLASIRDAGGVGALKKKRRPERRPREVKPPPESSPMNMLDDLSSALRMRRQGISGSGAKPSTEGKQASASGALQSMMDNIPVTRPAADSNASNPDDIWSDED